jgi:transposase-like protein
MAADTMMEFDFKRCPHCGAEIDYGRDHRLYSPWRPAFRCHACRTEFEVETVTVGYRARVLKGGRYQNLDRNGKAARF